MALLSVRGLVAGYGAIRAVRGIDLEIEDGEIVTLIGANGAGKSTALRAISGLVRPREGSIVFRGRAIDREPPHRIVEMGLSHVPEGRGIFARLTVMENLQLGGYRQGEDAVERALPRIFQLFPRLKDRLRQPGGTLSGGEQQMLAIARALVGQPRLLLLDEPSMGLAPLLVGTIFEVIQEIRAEGTPILLVEQNAMRALEVADRGYVLEAGRVTLQGTGEELARNDAVRKAYLGES